MSSLRRTLTLASLGACLALGVAPSVVAAQRDTSSRRALPAAVVREIEARFNAPVELRTTERLEIARGQTVRGDVAVLDGPVIIEGRVTGSVIAINADVILRPSARIDGDLLVVGGEVEGRESGGGFVGGEIRVVRERLRYTLAGERLTVARDDDERRDDGLQWWQRWDRRRTRNRSSLFAATGGAYNRVEGLPVVIGPRVYQDLGVARLRVDVFGVVRTGSSFQGDSSDLGHDVRLELRSKRRSGLGVGGRLFDIVEPTETWQLNDLEAGLGAFLARRDYRDYFGRHGGQIYLSAFDRQTAELTLGYGHERWGSRNEENPFSLFRPSADWRESPQLDEGRMHLLTALVQADSRNDEDNPWNGWYLRAEIERGAGTITRFAPTSPGVRTVPAVGAAGAHVAYTRGLLDVRRYNRLGPDAQLNARLLVGGWLSGDELPLQRRVSVDGPGSTPGFGFRRLEDAASGTCGDASVPGLPVQCERMALAQLEYRGDLEIDLFRRAGISDRRGRFRHTPTWVAFADFGRGWLVRNAGNASGYGSDEIPRLTSFRGDVGVGLDFAGLGVYVAKAVTQGKRGPVGFVRLQHRF